MGFVYGNLTKILGANGDDAMCHVAMQGCHNVMH